MASIPPRPYVDEFPEHTAALEEIDAAWSMIEQGWDIESREELERQAKTNGFKYGLAQAVHHMWKRCLKENPPFLRVPPAEPEA